MWEIHTIQAECGSGEVLSEVTILDTICVGDAYEQDDPEGMLSCTTTITSTTIESTCSGSVESFPAGCVYTLLSTFSAERAGDVVTGSGTTTTSFTEACGLDSVCVAITYEAMRVGGASACDGTPVVPASWGGVKATYR